MRRLSNPFCRKLDFMSILQCLPMAPRIPHLKKYRKWILIMSKFRFIVVQLLVFFPSLTLHIDVLCVLQRYPTISISICSIIYVWSDFFPSSPSHISLLQYVESITWQMATYSTPPSSSNKKYGSYVLRFIDGEAIENLD
jgi:hypothetical protein